MDYSQLSAPRSPTWCPGCGNYGIWASLKNAISKLGWGAEKYVMVYGVGCSGNMTDFIKSHGFHSLHGRSLPNAEGIKLANHELEIICMVGDGDCYGEGGNHLLHGVRGNTDINVFVHDNRIYGLTTGQASPTSPKGFKSKSTPFGLIEQPLNSLALGIIQGATFVAQGFAGDVPHLQYILENALQHKGFTLVNVLQPCVTFNKVVTYQYLRERIYKVEKDNHNRSDFDQALKRVLGKDDKIPIGILYQVEKPTYQDQEIVLKDGPLAKKTIDKPQDISELLKKFT